MAGDVLLVLVGLAALWLAVSQFARGRNPVWWWYLAGYPYTVFRVFYTWRTLCVEAGLSGDRRGQRVLIAGMAVQGHTLRPIIPSMRIGRPLPDGLIVQVRLIPGQVPDLYAKQAEAIMHAWRVYAVRVSSPRRGWVQIRASHTDALGGLVVRDPSAPLARGPDHPTGAMVLALVVGVREDAAPWVMDLRLVPHWMIVGATRSGKSTLIHAIVVALAPLPVAIVGIDLKGGLELSVYAPRLSGLATDRNEAADLLEKILDLAFARMEECRAAGVQSVWNLPTVPVPVVVIVDEVAELYLQADASEKPLRARTSSALIRLAQLGAALGFCLLVCGQRIGSDLGDGVTTLRAQLGGRISHRVNDDATAAMCLGDMFPEAVHAALQLTPMDQGVAITTDGAGGWVRARSALTTAQQAADTAKQHTAMTPALPGIARPSSGHGGDTP